MDDLRLSCLLRLREDRSCCYSPLDLAYVDIHGNAHLKGLLLRPEGIGLHDKPKDKLSGVHIHARERSDLELENHKVLLLFVEELVILRLKEGLHLRLRVSAKIIEDVA